MRSTGWSSGWHCGRATSSAATPSDEGLSIPANAGPPGRPAGDWPVVRGTRYTDGTAFGSNDGSIHPPRREHMADSHQMFIGGEWVNSSDGGTRDIITPPTGTVMATVREGTAEDANRAVGAAKK